MNFEKIEQELQMNDFFNGRMIGHSKSAYREKNPHNTIAFNGNIFIKDKRTFKKIFWGDLDINVDGEALKAIAIESKKTLYVLNEMDGRFENDNQQDVVSLAIWNTEEEIPFVSKESIIIEKENSERVREERKAREVARIAELQSINSKFKIKEATKINNKYIQEYLKIYDKDIETAFDGFRHGILSRICDNKDQDSIYWEKYNIKKEPSFSSWYVERLLTQRLKIELKDIDVSYYWSNDSTFEFLSEYDYEIELLLNPKAKREDTKHWWLCNINYEISNKNENNLKTFKNQAIYVLTDKKVEKEKFIKPNSNENEEDVPSLEGNEDIDSSIENIEENID